MLVALGEVGGNDEYEIVRALQEKKITKPLVIWVTGTCAKAFKTEVQFGHAGAKANIEMETADAKNKALREAGAYVPDSFDDYDKLINKVYTNLVKEGVIIPAPEPEIPKIPVDYDVALKSKMIRRPANFVSSISDDRGEECLYGNKTISQVVREGLGIGGAISLLWFKRLMPQYALKFIEMCLIITADHGPAVSGAHNCIVATRAGKDLISSLASGMLTIGPRFGGAIDGAAQMISEAYDKEHGSRPVCCGDEEKGVNIQGIGHRIKSTHNPDLRVTLIKEYAQQNFKRPHF